MDEFKDLEYSGRKANVELGNFRLYGKSKHQQYFTSMELSHLICDVLRPAYMDEKEINVLDPTCGSGRLLIPWKKLGADVLGIELDKGPAKVAKRLLGEKNVRVGDILDYAHLLRSQFDLAVTNPPYGIMWQAPEEQTFDSVSYGGNIESQAATIEICTSALRSNGLLAAIIPTTTFTNQKDAKLREHLFKNYRIWLRVNLGADFKKEYGIEAEVDLVIGQREYCVREQKYETVDAVGLSFDERFLLLTEKVHKILDNRDRKIYCWGSKIDVPDLSKVKIIDASGNSVHIKPSGFETKCHNKALIDFYDRFLTDYNPVYGTQSGIADAYLSGPALIWRGADPAIEMLKNLGFDAVCDDDSRKRLSRLRKKYANLSTPIYRPKSHQLLAYFYDKEYVAKADVHEPDGELLFREGESYHLHPAWERNRETVDVAEAYSESKKRYYTIRTDIDRGFLAIRVQTEAGERIFKETEAKEVELFMKAFDVSDVGDIQLLYPGKLSRLRERVEKEMPFLFDYQKEDVARLALKPFGYLGYDMGGGKSVTSVAWAVLRGYRRILVICHSGLVKNFINELDKFGFRAKKLTTHRSVEKLLKNLDRIKKEGTTFYVTSYEFLSLDTGRRFDPWDCIEYDRDGNIRRETIGNTYRKCKDCGRDYSKVHKSCPKCEEVKKWTGIYCNKCGYSAYTYTSEKKMYPAYKRMSKLFDAVIVDEAQVAKSKNTMRGRAVRAMKSKGKLILTGTLMKGYVTDVFWNIGWLLGHGNPLFPYDYRGGSKRFLEEFGTFKYVTKEFEDTLHEGRAQLIPEVSNLNRFWRIIASFTIRRMKDEMVELPKKHKHVITMAMDPLHADVYESFRGWAQNLISREFQNATRNGRDINMGVISKALWKLRFAATVPNAKAYLVIHNAR